jgi:heme exporter protein B
MSAFMAVLQRDLRLALRRKSEVLTAVFFFVVVATLFPLAIGPEPETLRKIAPGILWVGAMLASLLSLGRLFAPDYQDGSLEQMSLSQAPLPVLVAAKVTAHWLLSGLPLTLLSPLLALQFGLDAPTMGVLLLSLLVGTPLLSFVGAVGAALTLGVRGGEVLLSLLVLPLYIPALVFGSGAVEAQLSGLEYGAQMSILMGMLLLAVFFGPWACALALRIALE